MKKLLLLVLLLASVSSFSQVANYYKSVYSLYTEKEDGGMEMSCTATAFESKPVKSSHIVRFVTASHCVEKASTHYYILDGDGYTKVFLPVVLIGAGNEAIGNDFAVFELSIKQDIPIIQLGEDPHDLEDQDVLTVSDTLGLGKQVLRGYVSRLTLDRVIGTKDSNWDGYLLLQLNGSSTGSSGSAIICLKQDKICGFLVGEINHVVVVASKVSDFNVWYEKLKNRKK
jgi:hypothetical protein